MDQFVALDALPAATLACDAGGRITAVNRRCARLFAAADDELTGEALASLFPDESGVDARMRRAGESLRLRGRRRTGVPFTVEIQASEAADGTLTCLLWDVMGDRELADPDLLLNAAFDVMPTGMALFNVDGQYLRVNHELCRILGRSAADLVGRRDQELTHPDDRQSDVDAAWRILEGELDNWQTEKRFVLPDGEVIWTLANLTFLRDASGRPLCWVGQFQDITSRKRAEGRLRHLAEHDDLTGLANRRRIVAELELRLQHAARHDETGAVLLIDLDGFKAINDTRGHRAGDAVLVSVSAALKQRLRGTDVLGRLGGDEFAVILPHVTAEEAMAAAAALLDAVRETGAAVTASCGVALYGPDRPGVAEALLAAADRAMYEAKARGRDGAELADGLPAPALD